MPAKRTMRFLATRSGTSLLCAARSWALVGFQGVGNVRFRGRPPFSQAQVYGVLPCTLLAGLLFVVRSRLPRKRLGVPGVSALPGDAPRRTTIHPVKVSSSCRT